MTVLQHLNPALATLPVYQPGRPIEEVARELGLNPDTVIKLASNENPLGPSPAAVQAMSQAIRTVHLYPDGSSFHLKRRLAQQLELTPAHIILGNGSNEILELIGHAWLQPGTDAVVSQYCFAVYPIVTHLFGANLITVPAVQYGHDLPALKRAITPATRVVFVANPNNPTGTLNPPGAVADFLNGFPDDVVLVMDEAYLEFLDEPADLLPEIRNGQRRNLILARTFSKIYGLAGLRLGYGLGHPETIAALEKIREPFNVNSVAQAAALAALDDLEHVARTRETNRQGLEQFHTGFAKLGLAFVPSAANFMLVRVQDGQRVFLELQKQGVIVRPMGGYQLPEWIRVSVGTPAENDRCLAALRNVLNRS
ncbi:MAG: histidinol-phosphate transaminase [Verrucomicrobia bacterium]|nr:histidinol-phosphate transaminase [Verrucomicrobiota bacterium]